MKQVQGDIWIDEQEDGTINIGFVQAFINRKMNECFHVLQADTRRVEQEGAMLVIETNDALESIKAPITGQVSYFNSKARNFPDRLTQEDIILTLVPPNVKKKQEPEPVYAVQEEFAIGWNDLNENQQRLRQEALIRLANQQILRGRR